MRQVHVGPSVFRWRLARGFAFTPGRNRIPHPAFARRPKAWAEPERDRSSAPLPKVEKKVVPEAPKKKELTKEEILRYMAMREAKQRQKARRSKVGTVITTAGQRNGPAWATRRLEIRKWGANLVRSQMMEREAALAIASQKVWEAAAKARQEISKQEARRSTREAVRKISSRSAQKARQDRKERRARKALRARKKLIAATERRIPIGSRYKGSELKGTVPEDIRRRNALRAWKDIVGADVEAEKPKGTAKPFHCVSVRNILPFNGFIKNTDYEVVGDWNVRRGTAGEPVLLRVPGRAPLFSPPSKPPVVPPDEIQPRPPQMGKNNSFLTQLLLVARYMARYQKKQISLDDVDIIATRSVLEELCYYSTNRESRFARLNLYMVGTSLHVARPYTVDTDSTLIPIAGFGMNYEKAVTTLPPELHDSPTHLRNIKYKIGDLTCLVEAQVDAYCGKDACYMRKANYKKAYDNGDTVVETAGAGYKAPPRDGLAEIKTRSIFTKSRKTDEELEQRQSEDIRQTWFGRVTHMIQAHQKYGQFEKAEAQPIAHCWRQWEDANQLALQRLVTLLKHLRRGVKLSGGRNCAVLLRGKGDDFNKMEFFKTVDQEPTAPDELISEFWTEKQRPKATPEAWKEKRLARRLGKPARLNNDKRTLASQRKPKVIRVELATRAFRKYVLTQDPRGVSVARADHSEPAVAQTRESKPANDTSKTDTDKKSSIVGTKKVPLSQQNGKPAPKTTKTTPENGPAGGQMNAVTTTSGKAKRPTVPIKANRGQRDIAVAEKKTRQADAAKMAKAKPAARAFKPQPTRPKPASADDGWGAAFGPVPGAGPRR